MGVKIQLETYAFMYWPSMGDPDSGVTEFTYQHITRAFDRDDYLTTVNGKRRYKLRFSADEMLTDRIEKGIEYVDQHLDQVHADAFARVSSEKHIKDIGSIAFARAGNIEELDDTAKTIAKQMVDTYMGDAPKKRYETLNQAADDMAKTVNAKEKNYLQRLINSEPFYQNEK